jgi:hypothetical protein
MFVLPFDVPGSATTQVDWRFCDKCFAMFFDGSPNKGTCPAGGGHNAQGFLFALPHDVPESPTGQKDWRFCDKCFVMFFDGSPNKGTCPAGGGHNAQGFMFVLPHTAEFSDVSLNIWCDSLRCHSETPGFGIGESDEPFVLVAVIDLENRNAAGIPPTEVILYGPLQDVDDQENHIFPFRPFWQRPFTPDKAIFLTAILEQDVVNPEVTRSAAAVAVQTAVAATGAAGASRERIISETLSAMSAAAEPVELVGASRLIGPPTEVFFTQEELGSAATGGEARQIRRFSNFGDYSVHYLARRV